MHVGGLQAEAACIPRSGIKYSIIYRTRGQTYSSNTTWASGQQVKQPLRIHPYFLEITRRFTDCITWHTVTPSVTAGRSPPQASAVSIYIKKYILLHRDFFSKSRDWVFLTRWIHFRTCFNPWFLSILKTLISAQCYLQCLGNIWVHVWERDWPWHNVTDRDTAWPRIQCARKPPLPHFQSRCIPLQYTVTHRDTDRYGRSAVHIYLPTYSNRQPKGCNKNK